MKKIEGFTGLAPRRRGGKTEYQLWVEGNGALYAQITDNIVNAKKKRGTHTTNLYRLTDYLDQRSLKAKDWKLVGIDPVTFEEAAPIRDLNEAGFLLSILEHLLPMPTV